MQSFAPLRVLAFTALGGVACGVLGVLVGGCDAEQEEAASLLDAAPPPPPGACVARRTASRLCEIDLDADADRGASEDDAASDAASDAEPSGAAVDGAAPDAAGIALAPPESANRCLVTDDVTIACPSNVAAIEAVEGPGGATDVVLAQIGLARFASPTNASLVPDEQAHLQHLRIDRGGDATIVVDPIPPFGAAGALPDGAFALLPASAAHDSQVVFLEKRSDSAVDLRLGPLGAAPVTLGAPFAVAASISSGPRTFASPTGEGFFIGAPRDGAPPYRLSGPLVLVRGLPDAPRAVTTSVTSDIYFPTTDPSGEPVLLFHDGQTLHLREGEDFGSDRWSIPAPLYDGGRVFDVGWVQKGGVSVPVVLSQDRDGLGVRFAVSDEGAASTRLGESFSTCPRSSYLGVTCDECPVDRSCELGSDAISNARFFRRGDRLFAALLATDTRRRMGYARSVVPIIDVGCACTLEERSKEAFADSLVVVEIVGGDGPAPGIVEWMRVALFKANATGHIAFRPRSDGGIDVVAGGELRRYDETSSKLPDNPVEYRLIRLSTALLP